MLTALELKFANKTGFFSFLLSKSLFFSSFSFQEYDPELFGKSLPCLIAIACALPPDYSLTQSVDDEWYKQSGPTDGPYTPEPINTTA